MLVKATTINDLNMIQTKSAGRQTYTMINEKFCYRRRTARRDVSSKSYQLLHNSVGTTCATDPEQIEVTELWTNCTTNPEQLEVTELEGYSRPTCKKTLCIQPRRARPSTSFVDHSIDLPWRNFWSPKFGTKFQREGMLFLKVYPNFLITQWFRIGERELQCQNQLYPSSQFNTIPACDGQTDRQTDKRTNTCRKYLLC